MMAHQTNQKPMANTGNNNQQQPQNYLDQGEDWDAYNQHQIGNSQQNQNMNQQNVPSMFNNDEDHDWN